MLNSQLMLGEKEEKGKVEAIPPKCLTREKLNPSAASVCGICMTKTRPVSFLGLLG